MSWPKIELDRVINLLRDQVGKNYAIGGPGKDGKWITRGKPSLSVIDPSEFDCSGLSRWIIGQGRNYKNDRISLPHGTYNQINVCRPLLVEPWRPLDLGFSESIRDTDDIIDHVIIRITETTVIEARGKPFHHVVQRPVKAWEKYPGFWGWYRVSGIHDNEVA